MGKLRYVLLRILTSLLRLFPLSARTGLIKIGNPDRNSPVFLTCNFRLTVESVKRALERTDAYLLVANSRGINVWCAAAGGLFTNHDVVSVLKTSGIEELVDHRNVILPQLAAAGVEAAVVRKKTGWKAIWGPVYAEDLPGYLKNDLAKTPKMQVVEFPIVQRLEMAAAWAFPISLLVVPIALLFARHAVIPLLCLVWGSCMIIYATFPLYTRLLGPGRKKILGFIDFERGGMQFLFWGLSMLALLAYGNATGQFGWGFFLRWGVVTLIVIVAVTVDLMGSTPTYKSGLHEDRFFTVVLDEQKCKGAGFCEQVCPAHCYDIDQDRRVARMARSDKCVQCGACIIQCPFDALSFHSPAGDTILPETLRKFKLNLLGKRVVDAQPKP